MNGSAQAPDPAAAAAWAALARARPSPAGHFDEWTDADGALRAPWPRFAARAGALDAETLARAERRIARQIAENGVTYTAYGGDAAPHRPWALDALPMLMTAETWAAIEPGLCQLGRLVEALARDLYGGRRLLADGRLPAPLVFPHRGFLRACQDARPAGGVFVHTLAVDLTHAPDGRWTVMGLRVQAPSGLGYALENRVTLARLFPDALRDLQARPVMPFCDALQDALLSAAPCDRGAPQLVLLTPGRFSETYFEHVYLARQLGVPLVEGGDLTVRQDRVFLKTVSGLQPVHAIWRRLDDDFSDPLELRADSTLGTPGLVQAWRTGHVLVANAFGLRVLESPALLRVLPNVARDLIGESLALPIVATTWPAVPPVDAPDFDDLVIKPARSSSVFEPVFGRALDAAARAEWRARLAADPDAYVLQARVPLSQAPVCRQGSIERRGLMLRAFLLADGRGDYLALPGGLSRVAGDDRDIVSGHRGGGSKDTWVLPTALDAAPIPHVFPVRATVGERTTPSRVAEHLFWLGRYAERSENVARLLRSILTRVADAGALPPRLRQTALHVSRSIGLVPEGTAAPPGAAADSAFVALDRALLQGLDDPSCQSLGFNVAQLDRVASSVRDRLSSDNWRVLHGLSQRIADAGAGASGLDRALDLLDDAVVALVAIGGLEMAHMTRDDGWKFLSLGRHIERLAFVSLTIDAVADADATADPAVLEWLLDLSDSLITYRARHARRPEWRAVVDLLLYDERNPRAALFQVGKIAKHVRALPDADLRTVEEIDAVHAAGRRRDGRQRELFGDANATSVSLPHACERLAARVSDALTLRYFSLVYELPHATVTA